VNREIKFRIYCFATKEFQYFSLRDGYPQGIYGGVSEPQQYTGMHGWNDKEIYEGDIVWLNTLNCQPERERENNNFEIIFERGCFQLKPIKLSKPSSAPGIGGGNLAFTHLVYIDGHDEDGDPIYRYELPPPQPLCNFGICVIMGNIFDPQFSKI